MKKKMLNLTSLVTGFILVGCCLAAFGKPNKEVKPDELPISPAQKNAILSVVCCAENGQAVFEYNYAENLEDGNGITFGIAGFSSGAYDGTEVIQRIKELDPENPLVKYLPLFQAIDEMEHNADGCCASTKGLEGFIGDFKKYGRDSKVKQAQLDKIDEWYWNPAAAQAMEIGAKSALTFGVLYDLCYILGIEAEDASGKGMKELVKATNDVMKGSPKSGIDEKKWLEKLLDQWKEYISKSKDSSMKDLMGRIAMYRRLINSGNTDLKTPFKITFDGTSYTIKDGEP